MKTVHSDADQVATRPSVLVADDDPVSQMVASDMLARWGIKPLLADDGGAALALACERRIDLILMDLQMPVLDGMAATRRIRLFEQEHRRPRVPVVAYTASILGVDAATLRACGLDAVLTKPCSLKAFHACLLRWGVPGVGPVIASRGMLTGRAG
jgi:CheY-like chemotaxis protein